MRKYYECRNCMRRVTTSSYQSTCPDCDGRLRNIAVPRE
ncbi:rubrerythrin-like domain-containing protein [Halomicrococcus sp. NG-SE-24]